MGIDIYKKANSVVDLSYKTAKSKSHDKEKNKTVDVFLFHGNLRESGVINMFMNTEKKI